MSLHNGIDTIAITSNGVYSTTYGVGEEGNTANLVSSLGYLEDAPAAVLITILNRGLGRIGLNLTLD